MMMEGEKSKTLVKTKYDGGREKKKGNKQEQHTYSKQWKIYHSIHNPLITLPPLLHCMFSLSSILKMRNKYTPNSKRKFTPVCGAVPLHFPYDKPQQLRDCFVLDRRGDKVTVSANVDRRCTQCNKFGTLDCYYYGFELEDNVCLSCTHETIFDTHINIAINLLQSFPHNHLLSRRLVLGICWIFHWSGRFSAFADQVERRVDHLAPAIHKLHHHLQDKVEVHNQFINFPLLQRVLYNFCKETISICEMCKMIGNTGP
jgi:hypothetical protein